MSQKNNLAHRLRTARELAGLSQGQTAKLLNYHRPTISEIEAGRRSVRADELIMFADLYGVETSWLTTGEIAEEKVDKRILAAARELSSMNDKDIDALIKTIQMLKSKGKKIE